MATVCCCDKDGKGLQIPSSVNKYLLLTKFEVRTVTYSTDRENEVSKIFIISLRLIGRAGKEQLSKLAGRTVKYGALN